MFVFLTKAWASMKLMPYKDRKSKVLSTEIDCGKN